MTHSIKNQNDKHIIDELIINEINHLLDHDLNYTYFEGTKIEIIKDFRTETERETIVKIEGI